MTVREMHARLTQIIESHEGAGPDLNGRLDLPMYVSVQISPRKFVRAPVAYVLTPVVQFTTNCGRKIDCTQITTIAPLSEFLFNGKC